MIRWIARLLAFALLAGVARADDTEIYFAGATNAGAPNILFILDASRSMRWRPQDDPPLNLSQPPFAVGADNPASRFAIMKNALVAALTNIREANVGLINYGGHDEEAMANGVKFPIAPVTPETVAAIENRIAGFEVDGFTPIVQSLYESARYFRGEDVDYGVSANPQRIADPGAYTKFFLDQTETLQGHFSAFCNTSPDLGALETQLRTSLGEDYVQGSLSGLRCNNTTSGTCTEYKESGECVNFVSSGEVNGGFWTYDYQVKKWRGVYNSPIKNPCQENVIVLLSDGKPDDGLGSARNPVNDLDIINKVQSLTHRSCGAPVDGLEDGRCGAELTRFLASVDQNPNFDGDQLIHTYVVGFAVDGAGKRYLRSLAQPHEGAKGFYTADNEAALTQALTSITADLVNINSSFSPPTIAVNQTTGLVNSGDVIAPMFRASRLPRWVGNIKRYRLDTTSIPPTLKDKDGNNVLDGNGRIISSARSYWLPEGDKADGAEVSAGGAARLLELDRNLWVNDDTDGLIPLTVENVVEHDWADPPESAPDGLAAEVRTRLVNFIRGVDPETGDTPRRVMGDVLHSRPVVANYGRNLTGEQTRSSLAGQVVFVGTNEGYLHAFRVFDGRELFAFMPRTLLRNVKTLYDNVSPAGTVEHPYGMDGEITVWVNDVDRDGVIDQTMRGDRDRNGDRRIDYRDRDFIWLFAGMRRGGRNYYALDVTDPTHPELKWVVRGGEGDFALLGQSWAKPVLATVELAGERRSVLVVSGGYDPAMDVVGQEARRADDQGNAIFFIDPDTGERLWWASAAGADLNLPAMTNGIPASTRVVDIDDNGIADRLYVADVAGRIFRIDLPDSATRRINQSRLRRGDEGLRPQGVLFADLSSEDGVANFRRFYYEPDVSIFRRADQAFVAVAIGSGYRAHPLLKSAGAAQNRLYVLRDPYLYAVPPADRQPLRNRDLTKLVSERTTVGRNGWYRDLDRDAGEKALARAVTFNNTVFFTTFLPSTNPPADVCSTSSHTGKVYALKLASGKPAINFADIGKKPSTLSDAVISIDTPDILSEVYFNLSSGDNDAPVVDAFIGARFQKLLSRTQLEVIRKVYWQEQVN